MLYVNLIEERLRSRGLMGAAVRFGTLGVVVVALVVGGLLLVRLMQGRELVRKTEGVRGEIKELAPKAEECKQVLVSIVEINPLWQLADGATTSQQTWGMVLRALSECRPSGGMISLDGIDSHGAEKEKAAQVTLRGVASNEFAISDYQQALNNYKAEPEAQPLFDAAATKLSEVTATVQEGANVKRFGLELGLPPGQEGAASVPK